VSKGWEVTNLEEARLAVLLSYVPITMGGGDSAIAASAGGGGEKGGSGRGAAEVRQVSVVTCTLFIADDD
jgi:hypothetical protein